MTSEMFSKVKWHQKKPHKREKRGEKRVSCIDEYEKLHIQMVEKVFILNLGNMMH